MALLDQQKLHKVLQGKAKKPEDMSDEDWNDMDLKAIGAIESCFTDEVMSNVMDETTVPGMWLKLESLYMTNIMTNKFYLKIQLYSLRMSNGISILDHLSTFNKIISGLLCVNAKLEEENNAILLLCSLPVSYDHLVT